MTVAELIKELEKMPQNYNVVTRNYDEFGDSWLEDVTTLDMRKKNKQVELL